MNDGTALADAPLSDMALVQACVAAYPFGTDAFEALLKRYEPIVFRMCVAYLGNEHDAEDAMQDALSRAYFALPKFGGRSSFRTWLLRIVQNSCAGKYGSNQRWTTLRRSVADDPGVGPRRPGVLQRPVSNEEAALAAALAGLSDGDRSILLMRHVAELKFKELAAELGLSVSASKMRLYRAERRLREAIRECGEPELLGAIVLLHALLVTFSPSGPI